MGTFSTRSLTPEAALTAARAALEHCRKSGWQAAVAVVDRGTVLTLPLPLAGLMTDLPVRVVAEKLRTLEAAAATLGVDFEEPFMVLSFITLSVIPRLRLTLDGVLDVQARELVPVLVS